jgi:site-specific DNA-methyltransferase (adenine-specific)
MGKEWDTDKGGRDAWIDWLQKVAEECYRVIKHGGHALVWALPRTSHWTGMAWENAGWEPRDKIVHIFGSGFPKSLDVSKSIEAKITTGSANKKEFKRLAGEQVERGGWGIAAQQFDHGQRDTNYDETAGPTRLAKLEPTTPEAKQWEGWGTALKPASEDWWLFRKPLDGTVAANVLKYGTGAINIDGCRVSHDENRAVERMPKPIDTRDNEGRWPANVILSKPEDEYALKDDITDDQRKELFKWFYENA